MGRPVEAITTPTTREMIELVRDVYIRKLEDRYEREDLIKAYDVRGYIQSRNYHKLTRLWRLYCL